MDVFQEAAWPLPYVGDYEHNRYTVEIYFAEAEGGCPLAPPPSVAEVRLKVSML